MGKISVRPDMHPHRQGHLPASALFPKHPVHLHGEAPARAGEVRHTPNTAAVAHAAVSFRPLAHRTCHQRDSQAAHFLAALLFLDPQIAGRQGSTHSIKHAAVIQAHGLCSQAAWVPTPALFFPEV